MSDVMEMDRPLAVSFDAVGTFLHFAEPVAVTYARFADDFGLEATELTMRRRLDLAFQAAPPMLTPAGEGRDSFERQWWMNLASRVYGCAPQDKRFIDCFDALFGWFGSPEAWRVHQDFGPMLLQLREMDVKLAVISNFDARLYGLLDVLLPGMFDVVALPGECGAQKPQAAIFTWTAKKLDVQPGRMMHLGDNEAEDVAAALQAGLHALRWSFPLKDAARAKKRLFGYWGLLA